MSVKTVTHRFNVWLTVPRSTGARWSKYPDYSAAEVGRQLRRALQPMTDDPRHPIAVEHADTTDNPL